MAEIGKGGNRKQEERERLVGGKVEKKGSRRDAGRKQAK